MKYILGTKIGMTQIFREDGQIVPVTLIEAGPCQVLQNKTKEKDGYQAIQIGFEAIKGKKVKGKLETRNLGSFMFVPLVGKFGQK